MERIIKRMFSVEIRINGNLVSHLYGQNMIDIDDDKKCRYRYVYHRVDKLDSTEGNVSHKHDDGIEKLLQIVLKDMEKRKDE